MFLCALQFFLSYNDLQTSSNTQRTPGSFTRSVSTIYSAGEPRSGSTFQFVLLCAIAHLRSDSVSCSGKQARLKVIKFHPRNSRLKLDSSTMLFTTVRNEYRWNRSNFSFVGNDAAYVQFYGKFVRCPLCEVEAYQEIFDLTTEEILQLKQYMRYWSILRQCCGSQMSKWYRAELHGCKSVSNFYTEGRTDYHMCSLINLTAVEERFELVALYKVVPATHLAPEKNWRFLWTKKGDCATSHAAVRSGKGFNLAPIGADNCT